MHIEIYSKEGCHLCEEAEEITVRLVSDTWYGLMDELDWELHGGTAREMHTYDKYVLGTDFSRNDMVQQFPDASAYPQILIDDFHVGGLSEYRDYITDHFYPRVNGRVSL